MDDPKSELDLDEIGFLFLLLKQVSSNHPKEAVRTMAKQTQDKILLLAEQQPEYQTWMKSNAQTKK